MATDIPKEIVQETTVALLGQVQEFPFFCIVFCINFLVTCPVLTQAGFQLTFSTVPQLYSSIHIHDSIRISSTLIHYRVAAILNIAIAILCWVL